MPDMKTKFFGRSKRSLDSKHRFTVPHLLRKYLADGALFLLFNPEDQGKGVQAYSTESTDVLPAEKFEFLFCAELDGQGRIVIPPDIFKALFKGYEWVLIRGLKDHCEITPTHEAPID